jgi:putative restriction endonuclease
MKQRSWEREELLLALTLYSCLPFGKYHRHNPKIIKLASMIERTPSAVAMKLSNFASLDPKHQARGIKGLQNVSQADRDIWEDINLNWSKLTDGNEQMQVQLFEEDLTEESSLEWPEPSGRFFGPTEIKRSVNVRLAQSFFRRVILTSYGSKCCVCGMPIPQLLIASHIVPWRDDENLRVNPHNGLCFCALHDKGFDRGLFTLGEEYEIVLGKEIHDYMPNPAIASSFKIYEGKVITLPDKFIPDQKYLVIHRQNYFLG